MDFTVEFLLQCILAAAFTSLFFGLPGVLSATLLGLAKPKNPIVILIAPALGLCAFGPFALLFTWLLGYSVSQVILAWAIFLLSAFGAILKLQDQQDKHLLAPNSYWLVIAAMFWAIIPTINIFPFIYENGLFVNGQIFDHMKIAIIDSIVREGLPPLNPYYAPAGERIPLVYYYAWHFDASLVKLLTGVSGWQAEVVFTWFTSFATISFLAALAIRLTGKPYTGFLLLLLAIAGPPANILPTIVGYRWETLVGYPKTHPLELIWIQLGWAPQHVFSALSSIILLFLLSHFFQNKTLRWQHAIAIGLTAAAGLGASAWVGGIALSLALPCLIFGFWLSSVDFSKITGPLILALTVCMIFSIPALASFTSGPSGTGGLPLKTKLYVSTGLFEKTSVLDEIGHIILYWVQFLPLNLGVVYILGMMAILTYRPKQTENHIFFYLSIVSIFTYFILIQFIQSNIMNNDFGWRSALVPIMLLLIWASVALTELPHNTSNRGTFALNSTGRQLFNPLAWAGLSLGVLASCYSWHWPKPHQRYNAPSSEVLTLHQDFLRLKSAWQVLKKYTAGSDLVQSNPDSPYNRVITHWPAPAALALFGDRPTAYTEPQSVNVFAHSYSEQQKNTQYSAVSAIFASNPQPETLRYARDTLNIKALLIDHRDSVWPSNAIENSGFFNLIEETDYYKIYLAN